MKSAAGKRRRKSRRLLAFERDTLVKPPGLCPGFGFPPEKEMQANSRDKKQKEQEPCDGQTLPCINAIRAREQHAVFDNAKPAGLRMERDVFFLPVKISESHIFWLAREPIS
jgi:hypothetical protein